MTDCLSNKPITDTIKTTDGPFRWTKEAGEVLEKLITLICKDPVLCQPNMDKPFELEVDTSYHRRNPGTKR